MHSAVSDCGLFIDAGDSTPDAPDGLLITIPDHDQLAGRVMTLPPELLDSPLWCIPFDVSLVAVIALVESAPARGSLCAPDPSPRALDRLVRTSCALII